MTFVIDERLRAEVAAHSYPLLFATISGAHLYGFPSSDSDYDLRGVHILPLPEVLGLDVGRETVESSTMRDGLECDLVTHDVRKFFGLLLKKNGYVLEQLYSPLVVQTTAEHENSKRLPMDASLDFIVIIILALQRPSGGFLRRKALVTLNLCSMCIAFCLQESI